jgi:hypothetical protein
MLALVVEQRCGHSGQRYCCIEEAACLAAAHAQQRYDRVLEYFGCCVLLDLTRVSFVCNRVQAPVHLQP